MGQVLSKKLDPTLNTSPMHIFAENNEGPTLMRMTRTLMALEAPKLGLYASMLGRHGLNHNFIRLGPIPPMHPSLPNLHARTCVGTLPHGKPTCQYPVA